jgi:peptidoglycan/xylan/chitin deacetylase (PgdA/CDA1 family)
MSEVALLLFAMMPDTLSPRLPRSLQRRAARWLGRRECRIQLESPVISFTFDDFPRSALTNGGAILRQYGFNGTYYASFGLMGQNNATGEIFRCEDVPELVRQGHELACHTFDHCDSWKATPDEFEASILRNRQAAAQHLPDVMLKSLSYPISWPRPTTKRRIASFFECARGGGQTFNSGIVDLNYLAAFFIEQSRDNFNAIEHVIDSNTHAVGWLIFATHDVSDRPTRFGCNPGLFERVVNYAAKSGAHVLPVGDVAERAGKTFS